MQSNLTRHVFRQIICNEPISHLQFYRYSVLRRHRRRCLAPSLSKAPSRPFFGFSRKPHRESKTTDLDQGYQELIELANSLAVKARPPPTSTIATAFKKFFIAKVASKAPLEDHQMRYALVAYKHLQSKLDDEASWLSVEDLQTALKALIRRKDKHQPESRAELAGLIFEELRSRKEEIIGEDDSSAYQRFVLEPYVRILAQSGDADKARVLAEEYLESDPEKDSKALWHHILRGYARERNDEQILRSIDMMRARGIPFDIGAHQAVTFAYVREDDLVSTKRWYVHPIDGSEAPASRTSAMVLKLCANHKDFEWGQNIFTRILDQNPDKDSWDVIFQWAAAKGKGVDEIERMMTVMVETNMKAEDEARPDIYTMNGLIELANNMNDPYTAERFVGLAHKWRLPLNARTYVLQLDYRIKIGDLDGARRVYKDLQGHEISGDRDIPMVNKLILALCNASKQDPEAIMALVEDLTERKARFEPATVSALCILHLKRNELHDVIDLLQTHAFHYDLDERALVRDMLVGFCLDRSNSTASAWDAYTISRQIFDETDREIRTKLMNEFFARKRSDMATHVFGHMRQSPLGHKRPTTETYAQCIEGIAKNLDINSLEIVHNMLKLDLEVEPDTRLHNALMMAYLACGEPERSLEFWDNIVYSREGPTYDSICVALRACQRTPFGERRARDIWQRLQKFEIEVTKEIYAAYVAALAGQNLIAESMELLGKMEKEVGCAPDTVTLGIFYNASPSTADKTQVEEWIKATYSGVWEELEKMGRGTPLEGDEIFLVNEATKEEFLAEKAALEAKIRAEEEDEAE